MPQHASDYDDKSLPETYTTDGTLKQLHETSFDVVSFFNENIPPLNLTASQVPSTNSTKSIKIQEINSQVQALLNKVNTHNIRSSNTLTQITDDILRSGNRLAYEVEILRGDANGLYDALTDNLQEDIRQFVLSETATGPDVTSSDLASAGQWATGSNGRTHQDQDPEFISQLRVLGQVKARLEAVINVFGEAMQWPFPQSEVSLSSSLISVSAPELGVENSASDEKAREIARRYRSEVTELLEANGDGWAGVEAATKKVEQLRRLASVWKGTAEEKARMRFVESLSRSVEDRKKALDSRSMSQKTRTDSPQRSSSIPGRQGGRSERNMESSNPAAGFIRNLQKLRDEIYLE